MLFGRCKSEPTKLGSAKSDQSQLRMVWCLRVTDDSEIAWILVEPAPDLPGVWVSHCLTFDLVSQGPTLKKAIAMIKEAIQMAIDDDLAEGRDPYDRITTPDSQWERLTKVVKSGRRLSHMTPEQRRRVKLVAYAFDVSTAKKPVVTLHPGLELGFIAA